VSSGGDVTTRDALDQGFVAASPASVYRVLADVSSYPVWWPGVEVRSSEADVRLRLPGGPLVPAAAEGHREGLGLILRLDAPLSGTLEWYLEPFEEGTVVNAILHVDLPEGPRRSARRLRRIRVGIHRGLVALKEHLA
jgi:uncharacterized protein YndB with AHSA1/START domain